MLNEHRTRFFAAGLFVFVFASDQAFKAVAAQALPERLACNASGPWGVDLSNGVAIVLAGMALAALLICWTRDLFPILPLTLLFGAGFSNLTDRIFFGCVRDFTVVSWYPAINLADAFLTVGAVMIVRAIFIHWKRPGAVAQ